MCCLKYEQDAYESVQKTMPRVGVEVRTPDGMGIVLGVNAIKESVRVRVALPDGAYDIREYESARVASLVKSASCPDGGCAGCDGCKPKQQEELPAASDDSPAPVKRAPLWQRDRGASFGSKPGEGDSKGDQDRRGTKNPRFDRNAGTKPDSSNGERVDRGVKADRNGSAAGDQRRFAPKVNRQDPRKASTPVRGENPRANAEQGDTRGGQARDGQTPAKREFNQRTVNQANRPAANQARPGLQSDRPRNAAAPRVDGTPRPAQAGAGPKPVDSRGTRRRQPGEYIQSRTNRPPRGQGRPPAPVSAGPAIRTISREQDGDVKN
jgi:hypothetical protein